MFRVHPPWYAAELPYARSKHVNKCESRKTEEEHDDTLRSECPSKSTLLHPWYNEESADESAHVEMHRIESDDGHGLQRVTVDDV